MPQGKPDCLASVFPARGAACLPAARAQAWDAPEGLAAPSLMSAVLWSLECSGHSGPVRVWPQGRVHRLHLFCPHPLVRARQPGGCPRQGLGAAGRCPQSPGPGEPDSARRISGTPRTSPLSLPSTPPPLPLYSFQRTSALHMPR